MSAQEFLKNTSLGKVLFQTLFVVLSSHGKMNVDEVEDSAPIAPPESGRKGFQVREGGRECQVTLPYLVHYPRDDMDGSG